MSYSKNESKNSRSPKRGFRLAVYFAGLVFLSAWAWAKAEAPAVPNLWEPDGIKIEFDSGEPGWTRNGRFVIDKKVIRNIEQKVPMDELRGMAEEVNADPSKKIQVRVAINWAPWAGKRAEENAALTGAIGMLRNFIADDLLRKAGLRDPDQRSFAWIVLETLPNGRFPRPFILFSVSRNTVETKAPTAQIPGRGEPEVTEEPADVPPKEVMQMMPIGPVGREAVAPARPFKFGIGLSETSPTIKEGLPDRDWIPALDLYISRKFSKRQVEGFCSFTSSDGLQFFGLGVIANVLDGVFGPGSVGLGILYDQYKTENNDVSARTRRIGPACQVRQPLLKKPAVELIVNVSLRYVDWSLDPKNPVARETHPASTRSAGHFSILCPTPTPTPVPTHPDHPQNRVVADGWRHGMDPVFRVAVKLGF